MPKTKKDDPAELLRLAITALDAQIAELQAMHTQLAAMIGRPSASLAVEAAAPQKRRKLSAEAKEKAQKTKPAIEKAKSKGKPAKARPALAKKKKSSTKKASPKPPTQAKKNEAEKVSK